MKNLQSIRKSHKLTQKEAGEIFGISERAFQHYELGTREPPLGKIIEIAKYFNVSIDYLVGLRDKP
jgi:transcriptional regulator with XRE-family HTH domain